MGDSRGVSQRGLIMQGLRVPHEAVTAAWCGWEGKEVENGNEALTFDAVFSPTPLMVRASAYDLILVG